MFSDPANNVSQFGLADGMLVADMGAGSGFYSILAAKAVMPSGKVFAIDAQKELLDRLKKDAHRLHVRNIDVIAGDLEHVGGTKLREMSVNAVIISNVLFMIENKKNILLEANRILKRGGRMMFIDWSASFSQMGPHHNHVVYKDDAMKLAKECGFTYEREISAGSHHYGIIFRKQS